MLLIPLGAIINSAGVVAGSLLGMLLGDRLSEGVRKIIFQGLGLCVAVMGLQMALPTGNMLLIMFSIALGAIVGELLDLDQRANSLGDKLKARLKSRNPAFTEGFVNATMLFCIGSLVILGPMEEGLTGNYDLLVTKAILDFFISIALAAVMGVGVLIAAVPVLLLEGLFTYCAGFLQLFMTPEMIVEFKACGGVMIVGMALNVLDLTKIKIFNLLPALVFIVLAVYLQGVFFPG